MKPAQTHPVLIRGGLVHDAVRPEPRHVDVLLSDGSPFEVMTEVRAVFIDGARVA
ncbi:MAG TPA: hypothetical protein IAA19_08550 [Candidatus Olsenella pullistercoris]|uniref:Uncharacterized protein n=1 Tax=Candidatus Olsenella pullistercoris TaxID=2838712 RepID=A0A9D2JEW2_9ACTN|nr:hypothetical protein [Candidatus Olsenella pullistercoris]